MRLILAELRLILRSRLAAGALALLFALSALAAVSGLQNQARQNATIDRVAAAQAHDFTAVAQTYGRPDGEAGNAAYYTFLLSADRPGPLAFTALGQRDINPFVLRVNALGIQAQLYGSEALNPELALPGVFDFAFVLIYLAPLVVIALAHDLVSGEREAGRLRLLLSMPAPPVRLWRRRVALRYGLVFAALIAPLLAACAFAAAPLAGVAGLVAVAALYLAFWFGLSLLVGARTPASATNAAALVGCWIVLTLIAPTLANAVIARAVPVAKGIDLTLAQRESVHHAWDIPKDATLRRFFANHPEWRDTPPVAGRFHWKWYYAMHQVGDEAVADQVADYRANLLARQALTEKVGWVLPGVGAQVLLHRIADTDLLAQLCYQDSIAAFHERLRRFFYPYLFKERPFTRADFDRLPTYEPRLSTESLPLLSMVALVLCALLALTGGSGAVSRIGRRQ
jgi:ABC-2 type transport system permease protein